MKREQIYIEKVIGRREDEYIVCDYVFKCDESFMGATGSCFRPVSKAEYEEGQNAASDMVKDRLRDSWIESVQTGATEKGLEEFCEEILAQGDEAIWDLSYYSYHDLIRTAYPELTKEEYPIFECTGGGRCFSPDMQWDDLYDKETYDLIVQYETKQIA